MIIIRKYTIYREVIRGFLYPIVGKPINQQVFHEKGLG